MFFAITDLLLVIFLVLLILYILNLAGVIAWFATGGVLVHLLIIIAVMAFFVWAITRFTSYRRHRSTVVA